MTETSTVMQLQRRRLLQMSLISSGALLLLRNPVLAAQLLHATPEQILGPFYPVAIAKDSDFDLSLIHGHQRKASGQLVDLAGMVVTADNRPIKNAHIEIWQANKYGRYAHPRDPSTAPLDQDFQGYGQADTDKQGGYRFVTIKPGSYPAAPDWIRPPHIHFKVSAPGFKSLVTQMYFKGESLNDHDLLLNRVARPEQLIVDFSQHKAATAEPALRGQFKIILEQA